MTSEGGTSTGPTLSDEAVAAARVCVWEWAPEDKALRIRAQGPSVLPELEGDWQIPDLLNLVDGLSRTALHNQFLSDELPSRVTLHLKLADGRDLRLLGARTEDGHARGLLFTMDEGLEADISSELEAVFQPIIHLRNGTIAGFEALARWRVDDGDLRLASELGSRSNPLNRAGLALGMLDQANHALTEWTTRFPKLKPFVQVNLTGADLFRPDVLDRVEFLVRNGNFAPDALRIELTEQMALRDFDAGVAAAVALEASGAALVLDDFGSGHSSLAWLAAIPAIGIKIDPQLTQMAGTPKTDTILSSIARLARSLGMTITAEGIEDFESVQFLRGIGCDYVQGFAYARPMTFADATRFLEGQKRIEGLTN